MSLQLYERFIFHASAAQTVLAHHITIWPFCCCVSLRATIKSGSLVWRECKGLSVLLSEAHVRDYIAVVG